MSSTLKSLVLPALAALVLIAFLVWRSALGGGEAAPTGGASAGAEASGGAEAAGR